MKIDGHEPALPISTVSLESPDAPWDVQGSGGERRWAFGYGSDGQITCRGDLPPGRTLVVLFDDGDLRVSVGGILASGMVVSGESSPAPYLMFDELSTPRREVSDAGDSDTLSEALSGIISQAMRFCGADRLLLLAVGRGDCGALRVGRLFVDSMVVLISPTAGAFAPASAGTKSATESGARSNFVFYIQGLSDHQGVSAHYLDLKRSVGVRGGTGGTDDGRLRFELSDPGVWENAEHLHDELQFWLEAATLHWQRGLDHGSSASHLSVQGPVQPVSTDMEGLSEKFAALQKQLAAVLAEHRGSARDIRVLTKEFRAEARLAHLSSARGVTETVSLLRLASLLFSAEAELPPTGSFAVRPGTLAALVTTLLRSKPGVVVECGSGSSTVWLAAALRYLGKGHVYALEHEPRYGAQTQYYLDGNDVGSFATIVPAPLEEIEPEGHTWYSRSSVESLPESIDFLFVDGPPKAVGEHARAPALAEFASRLRHGSLVLLDDMQRADEQEIVSRWIADPSLPELELVVGLAELHIYRVVSDISMIKGRALGGAEVF